jgi:hypothetical protein
MVGPYRQKLKATLGLHTYAKRLEASVRPRVGESDPL